MKSWQIHHSEQSYVTELKCEKNMKVSCLTTEFINFHAFKLHFVPTFCTNLYKNLHHNLESFWNGCTISVKDCGTLFEGYRYSVQVTVNTTCNNSNFAFKNIMLSWLGYGVTLQPATRLLTNSAATTAFSLPISFGLQSDKIYYNLI